MLSNRLIKRGLFIRNKTHRLATVRAMITLFEVLDDYECRVRNGDDGGKFLSTLGFSGSDRRILLEKGSRVFFGNGQFAESDIPELFSLIGVSEAVAKVLDGYHVIWEVFSSKKQSVEELFGSIYGLSKEGVSLLITMNSLQKNSMPILYYKYFQHESFETIYSNF